MSLIAVAIPIRPGKTADWRAWQAELNGPRRAEFAESRRRAGVHERTFLQPSPMGDFVIVTLEGEDPVRSFGQMMNATDAFTTWFVERVKAFHDFDPTMLTESPSSLVIDSEQVAVLAR